MTGEHRKTSVPATLIIGAVAALVLGGCTHTADAAPPPSDSASARPSAAPAEVPDTPTATASARSAAPAAGAVVLDTDLASADGGASLHLQVVATGDDDYEVHTSAYRSSLGIPLAVFFRQFDEQPGDTIESGVSFGYDAWGAPGETAQQPDAVFRLQEAGDDPSFLRTAVLVNRPETSAWQVLGVARLDWSTPDRHPDLHVTDAGARSGATGVVDSEGGVLRRYHVAEGDSAADIVQRFGITVDDLTYLNARQALSPAEGLPSGAVLNLDRAAR